MQKGDSKSQGINLTLHVSVPVDCYQVHNLCQLGESLPFLM